MAIAATLLTSGTATTGVSYNLPSVSPAGSSVLFLGVASWLQDTAPGFSVSGFSLGWSESVTRGWTVSSPTTMFMAIWRAIVTSAPGAGVITVAMTDRGGGPAAQGFAYSLVQVTGHNTISPILQAVSNSGTGTSSTNTLAAGFDSASRPLAFHASGSNTTASPNTNWTELSDDASSVPMSIESQWRSDAFDTSVAATYGGSVKWGNCAVEILAGASPTSMPVPRPRFHMSRR